MAFELILIAFFIFIIMNHLLNNLLFPKIEDMIEGMTCNPNKQSKRNVCFEKATEINSKELYDVENTTSDLEKKLANVIKNINNNEKTIFKNRKNIGKIIDTNNGKGVDNEEACAKYPEAC